MADEKDSSQNERPKRYLKIDDLNMEFTGAKDIDEYIDLSTKLLTSFSSSKPIQANLEIINDDVKEKIKDLESRIAQTMEHVNKLIEEQRALLASLIPSEWEETLDDLLPELQIEVEKEQYHGLSLIDLIYSSYDENGDLSNDSLIMQALKEARKKVHSSNLPKVRGTKSDDLYLSVDKINHKAWIFNVNEQGRVPGEITITNFAKNELLPFAVEGEADKGRGKERNVYYGIDFSGNGEYTIKTSKQLTAFDRRVHDAIGTLYNVGNEFMSMSQIAIAMGNAGRPNSRMIERIAASVDKMTTIRIILDQSEDYDAYTKIQKIYKGQLIAAEQEEAMINGQLVADALHVFREPLLMTFARNRRQVTKIPREVIETKKRQTENNLIIENYLLERISRMRNKSQKSVKKICYKTLFDLADISGKQRQRTIPIIRDYLDHYKCVHWIKDYKEVEDGVEIRL